MVNFIAFPRKESESLVITIPQKVVTQLGLCVDEKISVDVKSCMNSYRCRICENRFDSDDEEPYCSICEAEGDDIEAITEDEEIKQDIKQKEEMLDYFRLLEEDMNVMQTKIDTIKTILKGGI